MKKSQMSPPAYTQQAAQAGVPVQQEAQAAQAAPAQAAPMQPAPAPAQPECGGSMAAAPGGSMAATDNTMQQGLQQQMQQQAMGPAVGPKKGGSLPPSTFSFF